MLDLGPRPDLGYTANVLDRAAALRERADAIAALADNAACGVYVVAGELIVAKRGTQYHDPLFTPREAQAFGILRETVFLGLAGKAGRFGYGFDQNATEALKARDDLFIADLRSIAIQGLVAPDHLPPIAEAKALLAWHARHRFCSNCGAPSRLTQGGWRRDCQTCASQHFPRTDPVAIMLAVKGETCLLGRQSRFAASMWSCLAGFVEPGESLEEAVRREIFEEAGIVCGDVAYYASQPWPFPMSLMVGCHTKALSTDVTIDATELEAARWFSREEAAQMLLRRHGHGLSTPPPMAIAYHLIRAWVEEGESVFG